MLTLTARVTAEGRPITKGQIKYCDAKAPVCSDIHVLGISQLTKAGAASLRLRPGIGSLSYRAVFIPSAGCEESVSETLLLNVKGNIVSDTSTTLTIAGDPGNYQLQTLVVARGSSPAMPKGSVIIRDVSEDNSVLTTATLGPAIAGVSFVIPSTPAAGLLPYRIVSADFNGDGFPDFATANSGDDSVAIELGNGDGTFSSTDSPSTGSFPWDIVTGDFNEDGRMDLAVSNFDSDTVSIMLGQGNGRFMTIATPATGYAPLDIATGDFNEDGHLDLAVSNNSGGTETILLGGGTGQFTPTSSTPISADRPEGVVAGDFDNDGHLDLAVTDYAGQVQILLGNGDGAFHAGTTVKTGNRAGGLAPGDFDHDGNIDLAISNSDDNVVTVVLGNGNGDFISGSEIPMIHGVLGNIVIADFNQDGVADLAVTNRNEWGTVSVILGKGDGRFASPLPIFGGAFPDSLAVADFNGDGIPDIAATDPDPSKVTILVTQQNQTAKAAAANVSPFGKGSHSIYAIYPGSGDTLRSVSKIRKVEGVPDTK